MSEIAFFDTRAAFAMRVGQLSSLLYDQALLAEGSLPTDPAAFSRRLTDLMAGN